MVRRTSCPGRTSGPTYSGSRLATKFGIVAVIERLEPAEPDQAVDHPVGQDHEVPLGRQAGVERAGQVAREELLVVVDGLEVVDLDAGLRRELLEGRVGACRPRRCRCSRASSRTGACRSRRAADGPTRPAAGGAADAAAGRWRRPGGRGRWRGRRLAAALVELARNAANPTAADRDRATDEELAARDAGRRRRSARRRHRLPRPASGPAGGGAPPASTANVWSGDQVSRTSSPGVHSSARVARSTFCS